MLRAQREQRKYVNSLQLRAAEPEGVSCVYFESNQANRYPLCIVGRRPTLGIAHTT